MTGPGPDFADASARVERILCAWDALPEHRTATDGDAATADWLAGEIEALGLSPVLETFDLERRTPRACHVESSGARIAGVPCFDGGITDDAGVEGTLGPPGSDAPIGLARFSPQPTDPSVAVLRDARERGAHAAIVAVAAGESVVPGLALVNADTFTSPYGPPVVQVATDDGPALDSLADAGATVRVVAAVERTRAAATNVRVRIPGERPDLAPLVIMTPRSGWWRCTAERGGGIVAWLEALAYFARAQPLRDVVFTANSGHELGHLGLAALLDRTPELAPRAHVWMHLGANFAARGARVRWQASDPVLLALGDGLAADDVTPLGTKPEGEARNIFARGGRYVSLLGTNRWFHHPDDRWPHAVDVGRTARLSAEMVGIADRLAAR